ncbi:hypothetical protein C8Q77DRAFT_1105044 [Trametes polyzona]|nr:hypothetical protein C8Q77DRAFT_1105044 [Trametes polyzona]
MSKRCRRITTAEIRLRNGCSLPGKPLVLHITMRTAADVGCVLLPHTVLTSLEVRMSQKRGVHSISG